MRINLTQSVRTLVLTGLAVVVFLSAGTSHAGWNDFWERFHLDTKRNDCWPEPFVELDRQSYRSYFTTMTDNGWRVQNTLSDHLFDNETQLLNAAGRAKVQWIVQRAPDHRRAIFVVQGSSDTQTQIRLDTVQQAVARLQPQGELPPVATTHLAPATSAGYYFNELNRQMEANVPSPMLSNSAAGGGGGGGGGSTQTSTGQ
ncbi:MAG: hypothetical protein ACI9HK_003374 [Pirellulaceae bacterium]|jgi:hypothetical protein